MNNFLQVYFQIFLHSLIITFFSIYDQKDNVVEETFWESGLAANYREVNNFTKFLLWFLAFLFLFISLI